MTDIITERLTSIISELNTHDYNTIIGEYTKRYSYISVEPLSQCLSKIFSKDENNNYSSNYISKFISSWPTIRNTFANAYSHTSYAAKDYFDTSDPELLEIHDKITSYVIKHYPSDLEFPDILSDILLRSTPCKRSSKTCCYYMYEHTLPSTPSPTTLLICHNCGKIELLK